MTITPFTSDDIFSMVSFNAALESPHWNNQKLQDCLDHPDYCGWKVEVRHQIVAYILMNIAGHEAHIMHLAVHSAERHKGYGAYLLKETLGNLAKLNKQLIILEVHENNQAAIALYEKCGFEKIGERQNYYPFHGKKEAAWVYQLEIRK
jgi:ribosomal-protein-alanine N-acetyltransferase